MTPERYKIHSQLSGYYWWPHMRRDLVQWSWSCLTCASRRVGRPVKSPLIPIPVAGPFDQVGVDAIQFPKSHQGNHYAVVFMDYLPKWPEVFPVADQSALHDYYLAVWGTCDRPPQSPCTATLGSWGCLPVPIDARDVWMHGNLKGQHHFWSPTDRRTCWTFS